MMMMIIGDDDDNDNNNSMLLRKNHHKFNVSVLRTRGHVIQNVSKYKKSYGRTESLFFQLKYNAAKTAIL